MISDEQAKENVAANVLFFLDDFKWSQSELARATGETQMKISNICRAKHLADGGTLARIAEVFHTSVDILLGDPLKKPEKNRQLVRQSA